VLEAQLDDGGSNCHVRDHPATGHSFFHATFNVLEALLIASARAPVAEQSFREAQRRAAEFMLAHRLYRSDRTGEVISERFMYPTYPDGITPCCAAPTTCALTPAIDDAPLDHAIALLRQRRKPNGRWPLQKVGSIPIPAATSQSPSWFGRPKRAKRRGDTNAVTSAIRSPRSVSTSTTAAAKCRSSASHA
jgi:hypothetical protein